jgi:uncharacterized membrane protein YfcA
MLGAIGAALGQVRMTDGRPRDWLWASIAAALMLAVAALTVFFIHPGTQQEQVVWYAGLLPGSIVGAMLSSTVQSSVPWAQRIVYQLSLIVFSFLWYWVIAFVVVKIVRGLRLARKV